MFDKVLNDAIEAAKQNIRAEEGDYIGEDGLLYCGRCNTAKEHILSLNGRKVPVICKCTQERDREEARRRQARELRSICFRYPEQTEATFESDAGYIPKVSEAAKRYCESFETLRKKGLGMLLYGPFGTGKSFYAYAIANALTDRLYKVRVWQLEQMYREFESGGRRSQFFDYLVSLHLAVIDDLGAEKQTKELTSFTFNVIDALYCSRTPFVVTTNVTLKELTGTHDGDRRRIYERILERCPCPILVDRPEGSIRYTRVREENPEYRSLLGI